MSMKPILFNTEMVRAILDGRKSCTRRVIKPQPYGKCTYPLGFVTDSTEKKEVGCFGFGIDEYGGSIQYAKPSYQPGDILYVRETWCALPVNEAGHMRGHSVYYYKADRDLRPEGWRGNWHPSIHMPKEAARIWLKVTDVRVERLHDITYNGALREGSEGIRCDHVALGVHGCTDCMNTGWIEPPQVEFMQIWDSTIKKPDLDQYGWDANPWVWVIEFERCDKPEGV
nr:MAG TPA: ASCH domain protein [Caudoviricetes sp.]